MEDGEVRDEELSTWPSKNRINGTPARQLPKEIDQLSSHDRARVRPIGPFDRDTCLAYCWILSAILVDVNNTNSVCEKYSMAVRLAVLCERYQPTSRAFCSSVRVFLPILQKLLAFARVTKWTFRALKCINQR